MIGLYFLVYTVMEKNLELRQIEIFLARNACIPIGKPTGMQAWSPAGDCGKNTYLL